MNRFTKICPKCGSADCGFVKSGKVKCNRCEFVGRTPRFRTGGPESKMKIRTAELPAVHIGGGAIWKMPAFNSDRDYD